MWFISSDFAEKDFYKQRVEVEATYRKCIANGEEFKILLEERDLIKDHSEPPMIADLKIAKLAIMYASYVVLVRSCKNNIIFKQRYPQDGEDNSWLYDKVLLERS